MIKIQFYSPHKTSSEMHKSISSALINIIFRTLVIHYLEFIVVREKVVSDFLEKRRIF